MAHAFQAYRDKMVLCSEVALIYGSSWLWWHAASNAQEREDREFAQERLKEWLSVVESWPGVLTCDLEGWLGRNRDCEKRFLILLEHASASVSAFGETVPGSVFDAFLNVPGMSNRDLKVSGFLTLYSQLRQLVIGEGPDLVRRDV